MRNKISAPVPWRKSINGWTDTLRAAGLSAQTIKSRRYKMVHLATLLMPSGPEDVTTEQIVQAFARQQWKPETRKAYRNTISSFFRWLHKSGRRSDDPSLDVPRVKKPHAHPRPCPDRYIAAAMKMATTSERLMIRLGAECGLRRGEIARVHSDDVVADSAGRSLIVRGKGDKQRIVPLPDDLATIVMDACGYLFPGRFGGHVEESYIGDHISRLLPDGYAAHSLRHRFATTAYAATHDLFVVAELLGHESVETTEHYVAMPDGRLREAMAAVRLI
ncbi:tyrosine-type recombinase/integrase [Bifidobacterium adolescentis]|nr:tyrosine-type recombinase/integrase [Bifidobacterium adolescentis]MDB1420661.1 tyrosine-type recombinase/integrase [Bifidobacterium adolescentis]MDB1421928.1 tyrosine-type recombinase/integrase [Bifidobacterium adolescentis]MDB1425811.1 tyrosine-type recombinase/integrase [Bifidobacterium adolescentis]MDB1427591.1 tyrosine-type recombinase/integrase [Bifidobacterium adolescentis]